MKFVKSELTMVAYAAVMIAVIVLASVFSDVDGISAASVREDAGQCACPEGTEAHASREQVSGDARVYESYVKALNDYESMPGLASE